MANSGQAMISIQKTGVIFLNRAAYVNLGKPVAVELLFGRGRRLVGLRPVDPQLPHARQVRTNARGTGYLVSAARFVNHYGISTAVGRRWPAQTEGDVLFVDIDDG